jgi:ABC-type transport system substrate-binding protein
VTPARRSTWAPAAPGLAIALLLLFDVAACRPASTAGLSRPATLTVGFGLATTTASQFGMRAAARVIALEGLATFDRDGRPQPALADSWSETADGLSWRIHLRPSVRFHDGSSLDANTMVGMLRQQLPQLMGPASADVADIAADGQDVLIRLRARSAFVPEALDIAVEQPSVPDSGTGPFRIASSSAEGLEMAANPQYYLGAPAIDRIVLKPYASLRAAWADMMRGQVDVLYDVGPDALDIVRPASNVRVFEFRERYAYVVLFNMRRPQWKDPRIRQALNMAIDRDKLVTNVFQGHGTPAPGPVWPDHWAYDRTLPAFRYDLARAAQSLPSGRPTRFSCLFADATQERLALDVQQQLEAAGIEMNPELLSIDQFQKRLTEGDFDAVLLNARIGPNLLRGYQWWHSGAPYNFGAFASSQVDASLDLVRHAMNDAGYREGVAAFERATVEDPPAIFLSWSVRARAVSSRFEVVANPGGDVLKTLRLWRPSTDNLVASKR